MPSFFGKKNISEKLILYIFISELNIRRYTGISSIRHVGDKNLGAGRGATCTLLSGPIALRLLAQCLISVASIMEVFPRDGRELGIKLGRGSGHQILSDSQSHEESISMRLS